MRKPDQTHDSGLRCWIESANDEATEFPVQNLPFGAFRSSEQSRLAVAIGDRLLDLHRLETTGLLSDLGAALCAAVKRPELNALMGLGPEVARALRARLSNLLTDESYRTTAQAALRSCDDVEMLLPANIRDYTDFYASIYHATNVGSLFRPDNPLLPNYKHVPIGYHGRASSVVPSGTTITRPCGQTRAPEAEAPSFGPCRLLDYEMEVGVFVGSANQLGAPVAIDQAEAHVFGLCLLNDWSARDIQAWEYQPLGPFLSKSFASTISPWVVTLDALVPFRGAAFERPAGDPQPLGYLDEGEAASHSGVDLEVEVLLSTERMRAEGLDAHVLSRANAKDLYWSIAQMLTHHTSNGCNLSPGDLFGSGTVSGPDAGSLGSLLEITRRGQEPVELESGETRSFLEDGDEIVMRGFCERSGFRRIGFGECRGRIVAARGS